VSLRYGCPDYGIDLTHDLLEDCQDIAVRLLKEVGFVVRNERFLHAIKATGCDGRRRASLPR